MKTKTNVLFGVYVQAMDVKPDAIALRTQEFYDSHDIKVHNNKEVG